MSASAGDQEEVLYKFFNILRKELCTTVIPYMGCESYFLWDTAGNGQA